MQDVSERVKIWNSFFKLARGEAKAVHELLSGVPSSKDFNPDGGTLTDEEFHVLATLLLFSTSQNLLDGDQKY